MTPSDSPDNLDDLLDRFAGGECTPSEAEIVARWLEADPAPPARRERLQRLRKVWEVSRRSPAGSGEAWDVDGAWRRAAARMTPAKKILVLTPREAERPRRTARVPASAQWAAAVALAVGGTAAGIWAGETHRLTAGAAPRGGVAAVSAREYVTTRGERAVLTLVDGTRVVLGAASRLTVSPEYGGSAGPRLVTLEGEGYFEAVHNAARPFTVRTGYGLVRDIGTKFVIRAYAPDRSLAVAVTEGEVLLAGTRLQRGDLGRLDSAGPVRIRHDADLRSYTGWIAGRLVFDDTPLAEAIPVLERWYDIDITVADSALYDRRLFATLDGGSVANVLDLVALSLGVRVERRGRLVTFFRPRQ